MNDYSNDEFTIGYDILGPFLVEFCVWLHRLRINKKIDELWFLAREGYLIYQVYTTLFPSEIVRYLAINKNVLRLPIMFHDETNVNLGKTLPSWEYLTISELYDLFDIHTKREKNIINSLCQLGEKTVYPLDRLSSSDFYPIWKEIKTVKGQNCRNQKELLLEYINDNGYEKGKRVGLINNSLNGSVQYLLNHIVSYQNGSDAFVGIQFLQTKQCINSQQEVYAWLEDRRFTNYMRSIFLHTFMVIEKLLFENQGTALRLEKDNPYRIVYENDSIEKRNSIIISCVHDGAVSYAKDSNTNMDEGFQSDKLYYIFRFLAIPQKRYVEKLANILERDVGREFYLIPRARRMDIRYLVTHNKDIHWKTGFFVLNDFPMLCTTCFNLLIYLHYIIRSIC